MLITPGTTRTGTVFAKNGDTLTNADTNTVTLTVRVGNTVQTISGGVTWAHPATGVYTFSYTVPAGLTDGQDYVEEFTYAVSSSPKGEVRSAKVSAVDNLSMASALEVVLAILSGKVTVQGDTFSFKKRDGTTTKVSVTIGTGGARTGSTITG